jgi:uncharacterized membrane protein
MKPLLVPILILAACGLAFSGYLTYRELFASAAPMCSPVGESGSALGAPPCVYGFFMYLAILALTVVALVRYRTSRS